MAKGGGARIGAGDVVRLGARLGSGLLRRPRDTGEILCHWLRNVVRRDRGGDPGFRLGNTEFEIVADRGRSDALLSTPPSPAGATAGRLKTGAMSFLAPHALTIANGEAWHELRPFNEHVLHTGEAHPAAQHYLDAVRAAFALPVTNVHGLRAAMGRAMVPIVLGRSVPAGVDPAEDVRVLFDAVQSPMRRKLLGFRYRERRRRLYDTLEACWEAEAASSPALIAHARALAPGTSLDALLEQIPHWMFTFTGSGTDLLARTLALVTSRAEVRRRVREEIAGAGPADRAASIERLPYLNACILETGRLFPPVTRTFHHAQTSKGETEYVHWFPLLQRDDALGPTVHHFRPERWLETQPDAAAAASNLFLRGPRACPGRDLILFVCRAALVRLIVELRVAARSQRLARDPLPVSFPAKEARFTVTEGIS